MFDFGRFVDAGGLLSRPKVGSSAALFSALRGRDGDARDLKNVLDDEFWCVFVHPRRLIPTTPHHYHHLAVRTIQQKMQEHDVKQKFPV